MNKLLALSVALLSVSLYGAEKSLNGLEGITSISVVFDPTNLATVEDIPFKKQIKLRLRQSGIKVMPSLPSKRDRGPNEIEGLPYRPLRHQGLELLLTVYGTKEDATRLPIGSFYSKFSMEAIRYFTFEANGKTYWIKPTVWRSSTKGVLERVRYKDATRNKHLNKLMDDFLLDYLKANPKKKEK